VGDVQRAGGAHFDIVNLRQMHDALAAGSNQYADLKAAARADLETHGWQVDYIEVRAARTLDIAHAGEHQLVVLAAARLGKTRLIDNIEVQR
jgi:pantoate--beta-alanine ligase